MFLFLDIYFYILVLVSSTILLVSDPGSVSSFFRDELCGMLEVAVRELSLSFWINFRYIDWAYAYTVLTGWCALLNQPVQPTAECFNWVGWNMGRVAVVCSGLVCVGFMV